MKTLLLGLVAAFLAFAQAPMMSVIPSTGTTVDGTKSSSLVLPELLINGSNDFRIYGADSQASSGCIIVSGSPSSTHDVLAYSGSTAMTTETVPKTCDVMTWEAPVPSGGGGGNPATICAGVGTPVTGGVSGNIVDCTVTGGLATGDQLLVTMVFVHAGGLTVIQTDLTLNGTAIATNRPPDAFDRQDFILTATGASTENLWCQQLRSNGTISSCDSQGAAGGFNSAYAVSAAIAVNSTFHLIISGSAPGSETLNVNWTVQKVPHI